MTIKEVNTVCFVGAGTMGCANSLVAAVSGYKAVIYDVAKESLEKVAQIHAEMGAYLVGSGYCTAEELAASAARITCEDDLTVATADADLVSESVVEELSVKRKVHRELDKVCPAKTILTTNTSALLVSDIEDVVERGDRFAALHSHLGSPLIDIVGGPRTSATTIDVLMRYVLSLNSMPLLLHKENRGYVLNALIGPVVSTAMMLVIEGTASTEDVDRAWMKYRRAPMGPFGMMDLFGLNVVYDGWQYRAPDQVADAVRQKILAFLEPYIGRGELGSKTRQGFYSYPNPAYEQPGFLDASTDVSIPNCAMTTALISNAILLASNDIADPDEIDRAWTVGMNLDTGPFGMLDEMGVDAFLRLLSSPVSSMSPEDVVLIEQYLAQVEDGARVNQ
ncbi:MAG: 3-hydroxyacyl-CoA dehydrogenase NAD-binding domain-containing protein [Gammaproteobacteria bacterium]|nr:3-hydroxyacyl-CoA dehydrogenase NAD-binding domain-containing protein [Gammaproteobacteria bacterium]